MVVIKEKMDMRFLLFILYSAVVCAQRDFIVKTDYDGTYSVHVKGQQWLESAPTFFNLNGVMYSSTTNLKISGMPRETRGEDRLGPYTTTQLTYRAGEAEVVVTFRSYDDEFRDCVIFGQHFGESGAHQCSVGDKDGLVSGFPSFKVGTLANVTSSPELGYLAYGGIMVSYRGIKIGRWEKTTFEMESGRTSGPLALFDKEGNAIFMSSFDNFMAASAVHDKVKGTYSWGIMGGVEGIPERFNYHTIMCYSSGGINSVIDKWGLAMRLQYDKKSDYRETDFTNNYLSYWSDNGAFYVNYYTHDGLIDNITYEDAILKTNAYADIMDIPYRSVQYSVWFEQGLGGGTKAWDSNPTLFKDGMQYMYEKTKWISTAHNRWWTSDTIYAKQNGGKYNWIIEKGNAFSLPYDQQFWTDMFRWSRQWGFVCFMQDWLNSQFDDMNATTTTVDVARTWLLQMGQGARENDVTVQYCMSEARHVLQSLEIPVVTQARASDDYNPRVRQWNIGISSMFAWAVGLAPFKDTFWTTSVQTNNNYNGAEEDHPALQVAVATLSMGPVGPGDKVGSTNIDLLMKCCAKDGLILKPSRPAMAIDKQLLESAFGGNIGPKGELWSTYSEIAYHRFGLILAADINNTFYLRPSDTNMPLDEDHMVEQMVFQSSYGLPQLMRFNDYDPLTITPRCTLSEFCLFYTSPRMQLGRTDLYLLGELEKFVPMSAQRISDIRFHEDTCIIEMKGSPWERVQFFYSISGIVKSEEVLMQESGTAKLYIRV